jgi:hypothetical protein
LLKKVAVESQKVKQQEFKNSESEDDSMFYLFSIFFGLTELQDSQYLFAAPLDHRIKKLMVHGSTCVYP